MRNNRYHKFWTALAAVMLVMTAATESRSCPFCSAPSLTFSEQLASADAAVLVQWVSGKKGDQDKPGKTIYEVTQVLRNNKAKTLEEGQRIEMARLRPGKEGDLFLIFGTQGNELEWGSPIEVTETSFNYIAQAPSPETNNQKRLEYFMKFLEFPDEMISNDAYAEFANAPYKDITPLADKLPRKKLAKWITNEETPATRLGLYGLLLGLCGKESDAKLMRDKITEETELYRLGIDGIIGGYLLLTGEEGLKVIEQSKFVSSADKKVPFSEVYAATMALRFFWKYGDGRISKDRLRQSMRLLLTRSEMTDLVIADLARWKDWSVLDQLMEMYDDEAYQVPSIKRAIVRYLLTCAQDYPKPEKPKADQVASKDQAQSAPGKEEKVTGKDIPDTRQEAPAKDGADVDESKLPQHVKDARAALDVLRKKDPKTVKEAERFFMIMKP